MQIGVGTYWYSLVTVLIQKINFHWVEYRAYLRGESTKSQILPFTRRALWHIHVEPNRYVNRLRNGHDWRWCRQVSLHLRTGRTTRPSVLGEQVASKSLTVYCLLRSACIAFNVAPLYSTLYVGAVQIIGVVPCYSIIVVNNECTGVHCTTADDVSSDEFS